MAMNIIDDIDEEVVVPEVVERKLTYREKLDREMESIENEVFLDHAKILVDVGKARDIDPGEDVPEDWIRELGEAEAKKRHRVARAAWMNAKEAPVFLAMSKAVVSGISKARAGRSGQPQINVGVAVSVPIPALPSVESDE